MSSTSITPATSLTGARPRIFSTLVMRELRRTRGSLVTWLLPAALLTALTVSMQPQMAKEGSVFEQKMKLMPPELLVALGMQDARLSDPASYLATNFMMLTLLGAVFAALLGATLVTHEEAFGTGEMLWSLPVRRRTGVLAKVLVGVILVVAWEVGVGAVAFTTFAAVGVDLPAPVAVARLFVASGLVHLSMLALALVATVTTRRPRSAATAGLGLAFGLYGVGVVASLADKLEGLKWISPFRYAEPAAVVRLGALPGEAWALVFVLLASVGVAMFLFEKKDLHA